MVEGIDPLRMCQMLANTVAESRQLQAEADPEIMALFQDWLEKLEEEAATIAKKNSSINMKEMSAELGLSKSVAVYLIARLHKKGVL
jgi:hypothetical protein